MKYPQLHDHSLSQPTHTSLWILAGRAAVKPQQVM
jgi:hypothetical protein